jgi:non-ribosomal peptide synthetase component E (peptide arylation enzyme)
VELAQLDRGAHEDTDPALDAAAFTDDGWFRTGDLGELVCVVVEREPGRTIDMPTLVEHLSAAGIMKQKLPERLELVDAMPRGATLGKVLKAELRKQFS